MKQGKQFMKAIMLVLALMVASYILYNVVRSASSGVPTAQAVLYAASDGVSVEGFVVRQETVIPAAYDLVLPTKGEGEKVACGEEVAVTLRSAAAQERQEEINQTEKELEQLRLALAYQSQLTDNEDVAQRIASSAASLAGQVAQRRLDAARTAGQELRSLILRQSVGASDTGAMEDQISQLQQQLDSLEASAASDTKSIAAQSAGYYSAVADGYETRLTPQILESMSVSDFQGLWEEAVDAPAQNAGRLIASAQWYYACAVESRYLEDLEVGDSLQVSLGGEVDLELNMTVTRVNREEEMGLLVLSSQDHLASVSALRRLNADVTCGSHEWQHTTFLPQQPEDALLQEQPTGAVLPGSAQPGYNSSVLMEQPAGAALPEQPTNAFPPAQPADASDLPRIAAPSPAASAAGRAADRAPARAADMRTDAPVSSGDESAPILLFDDDPAPRTQASRTRMFRTGSGTAMRIQMNETETSRSIEEAKRRQREKEAARQGICQKVLLEVNIAGEESKSGFSPQDLWTVLEEFGRFSHLEAVGLMAIPPVSTHPGENLQFFSEMRNLFVDISRKKYDNVTMAHLSMGMSGDYPDAIACGSTMVRVGTAIFGPRDYCQK
ncbi:MAG: hypothetical protein BHW33_05130 [Firmicutes bacterium CAG:137_57_8]|nr:MAG: hypothetical protein BHW33_05130 [Firmicutes bacterium CAG:137_57_8]